MKTYSTEEIGILAHKFAEQKITTSRWTHTAHLIVGIYFLSTYEFYDAVCRIKSGIILLNSSFGNENTGQTGYHETLTIFWAKIIKTYLEMNAARSC